MSAPAIPQRPDDVPAYIAQKLRFHSAERVINVGAQTGWWTGDDVDWVLQGGAGPRPEGWSLSAPGPETLPAKGADVQVLQVEQPEPAAQVDEQLVEPAPVPPVGERRTAKGRPVPYIAALRACELFVDTSYQRELDLFHVRQKVLEWDPTMLGVLEVSDRGEGATPRYAVINGQHRRAMAIAADWRGEEVPLVCNVHRGLTPADEADLMYQLDRGTKALTSWDKWRARLHAGDPVVAGITEIATSHSMSVTPGSFGAVGAAEKLWRVGGRELVTSTVTTLVAAYGANTAAVKAPMVTAVGTVLHRYAEHINADRLIAALRKTSPQQLRAAADSARQIEGGSLHALIARVLVAQYNRAPGPGLRLS